VWDPLAIDHDKAIMRFDVCQLTKSELRSVVELLIERWRLSLGPGTKKVITICSSCLLARYFATVQNALALLHCSLPLLLGLLAESPLCRLAGGSDQHCSLLPDFRFPLNMKTLIRLLAILILVSPGRSVQGPRLHSWCWQRHHREC